MAEREEFEKTKYTDVTTTGPDVCIGDIVGGDYRIKSVLGAGGMGTVYLAEHLSLQKDFALKIVNSVNLSNLAKRRFIIEAKVIAKLNHSNIVHIYNMGLHKDKLPYYAMEIMTGKNLSEFLGTEDFSLDQLLAIFLQVTKGLGHAHSQGIVHRDVKPSNIILSESKKPLTAKIVDFGIAKIPIELTEGQALTAVGEVFGSPLYMSPEQCQGQKVDARSDIYSLGCSLFEMLTGKPPFIGKTALQTVVMHVETPLPKLSDIEDERTTEQINLLLERMTAKEAQRRYKPMAQVAHDLERIMAGKPIGETSIATTNSTPLNLLLDGQLPIKTKLAVFAAIGEHSQFCLDGKLSVE